MPMARAALDGGRRLTATANAGSGSYPGSNVLMADGDVLTWSTSRARCLAQYYGSSSGSYPYDDGSSNCDSGSPGSRPLSSGLRLASLP